MGEVGGGGEATVTASMLEMHPDLIIHIGFTRNRFFIATKLKINKAAKTTKRIKQDTQTSIWAENG